MRLKPERHDVSRAVRECLIMMGYEPLIRTSGQEIYDAVADFDGEWSQLAAHALQAGRRIIAKAERTAQSTADPISQRLDRLDALLTRAVELQQQNTDQLSRMEHFTMRIGRLITRLIKVGPGADWLGDDGFQDSLEEPT